MKHLDKSKKMIDGMGYSLTPPVFMINLLEWVEGLSMNQVFTFIISTCVVVFWLYKIKEARYKARKAVMDCEKPGCPNIHSG